MRTVKFGLLAATFCLISGTMAHADSPAGASCEVTLEEQGTYYDPAGALKEANPASKGGWIMKGLVFAMKGAQGAKNWYEGRGVLTSGWTVHLHPKSGTLPKGTPKPKNFTTANNLGEGEMSAKQVAAFYAQEAGCASHTIKRTRAPESAHQEFFRALPPLLQLLFHSTAAAEAEPKLEPVSLHGSRASFENSAREIAKALRQLSSDGCVSSPQVTALAASAAKASNETSTFVSKNLDRLEARVAAPMVVGDNAACSGSFSAVVRELEIRRQVIENTRQGLSEAAGKQFQIVAAIYGVKEYSVREPACAARAFGGFRSTARNSLGSLGAFGQMNDSLSTSETELTTLIGKNRALLASCGRGESAAALVSGRANATPAAIIPSGPAARAGASDITGIKENAAKQPKR